MGSFLVDMKRDSFPDKDIIRALQTHINLGTEENRRTLNTALAEILEELEDTFSQCTESEGGQPRKRQKQPLFSVVESTSRVHAVLSRCFGASCPGHLDSAACLLLATYSDRAEAEDLRPLDVLFTFDPERTVWGEVRILVRLANMQEERAEIPKVRFALPPIECPVRWKHPQPQCVARVCEMLGNKQLTKLFRMNSVLEGDNQLWAHKPTGRMFGLGEFEKGISLEQLITMPMKKWDEMGKLILALILGYSLFYLYDGPWIGRTWPAENIMFFPNGNFIPLRPFLRTTDSALNLDEPGSLFHRYPILIGFAVTLLEIHLGQTLDTYLGLDERLGDIDDVWAQAMEVYAKRKRDINWPSYRNAINACLDPSFELQEVLEGDRFRDEIYNKIIAPLEADLDHAFSAFISVDNLDQEAPKLNIGTNYAHKRRKSDKCNEKRLFVETGSHLPKRRRVFSLTEEKDPTPLKAERFQGQDEQGTSTTIPSRSMHSTTSQSLSTEISGSSLLASYGKVRKTLHRPSTKSSSANGSR